VASSHVGSYRVALAASAEKELHGLPNKVIARIVSRLEHLVSAPRPPGCKKLKGGDNEWRIRVGDYRIVYAIDDTARTVDVTRIAHRRDVYE
jgi:mRNA interferase RelE/StbE